MSSLFSSIQVYGEKWQLVKSEALDEEDKALFTSAKVVDSQFGKSVCFFLKRGGCNYIPISQITLKEREVKLGDPVDLNSIKIETLSRSGEADIHRVRF